VVRTPVYDRGTFPSLRQLTGDLLGLNRPVYVSQYCELSLSSSCCRQMSSKLNSGFSCAYMRSGATTHICTAKCLRVKADVVLFADNTVHV